MSPKGGGGASPLDCSISTLNRSPIWRGSASLAAPDKIAAFYADAAKVASDRYSRRKAYHLRALSTENGLAWRARRFVRFLGHTGVGALRRVRDRVSAARGQDGVPTGAAAGR